MRAHLGGIGGSRLWGMLGTAALASLVAGCGWFDSTPQAATIQSRPGAERSVPAGGLQASGSGRQYDGEIRPVDDSRTAPIGSVIADKGGQKAQLDAVAKDAAERDAKAREANAKRDAEAVPPPIVPGSASPAGAAPVPPPGQDTSAPVPLPGPVTAAPMPLPAPGPQPSAPLPPPAPAGTTTTPSPATPQ
jgi:hypothetical protein